MRKLSVDDREDMVIALQNEISRSPESRYDHRLHGVLMVAIGMSCYDVSRILGHSPSRGEYFLKQFNDRGFVSPVDRQRAGRPSRISQDIMDRIDRDPRKDPHYFGYRQKTWDGILLMQHLFDHYGIDMGVGQCQNIFHTMGFRLRRPRPMIARGDQDLKDNFKKLLDPISPVSGDVHMIPDNAKYHHANLLKEFLDANPHIILEFPPPYSPELNTMERVRKILRSRHR